MSAWRFLIGLAAILTVFGLASHADRLLPGAAGAVIRHNVETRRAATGLFYTDVEGWRERIP